MQIEQAINVFAMDLRLDGRTDGTIAKHRQELARYARWLESMDRRWQDATPLDVRAYVRTRVQLGHSGRGNMMCSLRVFHAWATTQGLIAASPAESLRTPQRPKPQPRTLKQAHVRQLLGYLAGLEGLRARRDEALVLTAVYTGLRASELAQLRWGDVDLDAEVITIWISKMNHGRVVPIHPQLKTVLIAWQKTQALGANAPVFGDTHQNSTAGRQITPGRVGKIVKGVAEITGLPLTAHVLRHTFATWLLRKSKDLYAVSKALGHAALKQTEIYVSAEITQIAAAVATLPGLDAW
jgi:site-specific recombinase XerD